MPAASVATSVTSARPIISAAAVDAVRCGLRRALSRASGPAAPPICVAGQPRNPASGRDERRARASRRRRRRAASPTIRAGSARSRCRARRARARAARSRRAVRRAATGVRKRWNRPGGSSAPSRTAAIGGTRVARSAGKKLAISVTRIPERERDHDRARLEQEPVVRQREPDRVEQREEALRERRGRGRARRSRRATPIDERLEHDRQPRTWRRDAPSVRSVASSRVRCAIVIESELTITNAPTKSAISAEREQEVAQEAR